jgi:MATE family multidrug resistance protein
LGIPSALSIGVEVTSFTLLALFIARLGVTATASHQIASNLTALLYMVPLSLSIATSARTSFWLGANQPETARRTLMAGLQLTLMCALALSMSVVLFKESIAHFYSHSTTIAELASLLLAWVAFYHVADALQVFSVFTLRCYRITFVPLMIYTICLWGIGLTGGYWVAYGDFNLHVSPTLLTPQSPLAFWQTSAMALWLAAMALVSLLLIKLRRSVSVHSPPI